MQISRFIILTILILSTSACIQLGESVVPDQYFVLEPMSESADFISDSSLFITIESVDFPDYLKRPQVVQHQKNLIYFSDIKRWASPLEDQFLSILSNNLERLLPYTTISISPWQNNRSADYKLQIWVKSFSGILGQTTDIDIHWRILDKDDNQRTGRYFDQRPVDDSYEGLVRALNRGLDGVSKELAKGLATP